MGLVHLHRHGDFSLLDGIGKDEDYAKRAAELGQSALALTDHGNLAGVLYHAEACEEVGIKPIVGMEAYFRPDIQLDRDNRNQYGYFHLVLLAKNQDGFRNLMRLSSISYTDDYFYQKPNIDWNLLRKYSDGLIGSSSCVSGLLPQLLLEGKSEEAEQTLRVFQDIFGDDFYLETQPHNFDEQRKVNLELLNMSAKNGIPVVAAVDAHYPFQGWDDTQDIALMIATNSSVKKRKEDEESGKNYMKFAGDTFWLMSEDELRNSFSQYHSDIPSDLIDEMINNSSVFAGKCEHFTYDKSPKIPRATANDTESEKILRQWASEGLERIQKSTDPIYLERLEEEFVVLRKLGVLDYFVIVGDMVRWAKSQGIRVGPGRGSAAGCLLNYLVGITAVDPIGYGLLFERFMNEYRTEIPDIDIDFQDDRRDEVKEYLKEKWGADHVVDIAAFQSFGLKAAIQDVCRALDINYIEAKRATDNIPDKTFGWTLHDVEEKVPEVNRFFEKYPVVRKHAMRLQGQMKGTSRHAAAVIVTDQPAQDLIPTMKSKDGGVVTQWSERANAQIISPYGFLKIDCLSLDSLTVQERTLKMIEERHGIKYNFEDPKQFPVVESPYNVDRDIIESFADGANIGIFQFESAGIVGLLKQIKPTNLEHVIAANALYRPGTLENNVAFDYAKRKNRKHNWKVPHKSVEQFLTNSFGFMIFQEQVMQIYSALAKDATPAESATFLKVVSKGIARDIDGKMKMQQYYDKFEEGCIEKGIPKASYELLWQQILQMSTYSFNKSHSTGYAVEAYQDKFLKRNYPFEFYTNLLSKKPDKIPSIIRESKFYGVNILPPDVNTSEEEFTIDGNSIRFGLLGVKNIGPAAIAELKAHRPFSSFEDMVERVQKSKVNAKTKKALFMSGALDSLGARHNWSLSEDGEERIGTPVDIDTMAQWERETMGFTISKKDDISKYKDIIDERITLPEEFENGESAFVAGEVINVKEILTKNKERMAFVELEYLNNNYNLTVFPKKYSKFSHMFTEGTPLLAIGDWDEERQVVVAEHICTAEQLAIELQEKKR